MCSGSAGARLKCAPLMISYLVCSWSLLTFFGPLRPQWEQAWTSLGSVWGREARGWRCSPLLIATCWTRSWEMTWRKTEQHQCYMDFAPVLLYLVAVILRQAWCQSACSAETVVAVSRLLNKLPPEVRDTFYLLEYNPLTPPLYIWKWKFSGILTADIPTDKTPVQKRQQRADLFMSILIHDLNDLKWVEAGMIERESVYRLRTTTRGTGSKRMWLFNK